MQRSKTRLNGLLLMYNASTLGIPNDPIFGGESLIVLFHSINFSGPSANHYDAIYRLQ